MVIINTLNSPLFTIRQFRFIGKSTVLQWALAKCGAADLWTGKLRTKLADRVRILPSALPAVTVKFRFLGKTTVSEQHPCIH